MFLQTDDQTIEDLRLFARREQAGIYDIYNNTFTRGGEAVLEKMFRNPLSDLNAIIKRSSVISSFCRLRTGFPFESTLLDNAEKYMAHAGENTNGQKSILGEKEISTGVSAVIELFWIVRDFIGNGDIIKIDALTKERLEINELLNDEHLRPLFNEKQKSKLSYAAVTAYDILIRVQESKKVADVLQFIYLIDVYISVASVAYKRNFIFPVPHPKGSNIINVEGVYHPELKKPVGNDLMMDKNKSVVFLTGANMAGKSTFLRSFSTAIYIAHMGFPVAAKSMDFSVMEGIYTTINLPDNLGIGASHFYAEVLRVKKIAAELNAGKSIFVLFDELFRGTNVKDAQEGTVAITLAFAGKKNCFFIISSHIVEAGDALKQKPNISFHYLPTHMKGNTPEYTYMLEEGITDDRHGMIIIRNEGILKTLANGRKTGVTVFFSEKQIVIMSFAIDRQSLDELNLMGKFRQGSVYFLFNQVKTQSGEFLIDQLFRNPLNDERAINERTAIFQFFQNASLEFPFDPKQVALMREYTDAVTEQGRIATYANILLKKTLSGLTRDERYKILIQGLQATIVTLKKCYVFAAELSAIPGPYHERASQIKKILGSPALSRLIDTDIYKNISARTIAEYDYLLKNKLSPDVKAVLDFIAEADVNIAVSHVAKVNRFTYANALPKGSNILKAKDLKHPCIDKAIGNDIEMYKQSNVIFLTGANMAGKSTWMKSIGIGMYLAHIGFPVAAQSMEFSVREGIYSSINIADNIALGYSHFYAEVVRVKNAADATSTGRHLLLMFDELFKGTNVKDAYDGTLAVTEAFAEYTNCLFIVSTHIIEVGEALRGRSNIQFTYMPTIMDGAIPKYTYRLDKGITEDRQGMMIIRNEKILELIGS